MKARKICLCAFVFSLLICGLAYGLSEAEVNVGDESVVNIGLAGVDEIYVKIVTDKVTVIDRGRLESEISLRLTDSGLKVATADVSSMDEEQKQRIEKLMKEQGGTAKNLRVYSVKVPEVIVRVSVLQGNESGPCVYHIQTSFAREVYLRGLRSRMKAEIWRIDVPIGIADANECEATIRSTAMRQVDAFVADWKKANTNKMTADTAEPDDDIMTSASQETDDQARQKVNYEYVASKNSKVFHKADCRAAARISSENLIGFDSREEAINSGRRPCKMCNP